MSKTSGAKIKSHGKNVTETVKEEVNKSISKIKTVAEKSLETTKEKTAETIVKTKKKVDQIKKSS